VDRDVAGESPVDRRRREEADVGAQVVAAGAALGAAAARHAGLERDALTDGMLHGTWAALDDDAGDLMAEHERLLDDERPDPAVLVVVHVGPADTDRVHLDEHVAFSELRQSARLEPDVVRAVQRCDEVRRRHRGWIWHV